MRLRLQDLIGEGKEESNTVQLFMVAELVAQSCGGLRKTQVSEECKAFTQLMTNCLAQTNCFRENIDCGFQQQTVCTLTTLVIMPMDAFQRGQG